uniref:Uncharacterized protein n=1 Tax=Vitis vinifera TaxID=29760 RepID=F6HVK6_VITVI
MVGFSDWNQVGQLTGCLTSWVSSLNPEVHIFSLGKKYKKNGF